MGLIKAGLNALNSTMKDQWKDYFYCDALPNDVLAVKGQRRGGKGNENVITSGSGIVVAEGQCMIIVDAGQIVEICAEAGEFTYDSKTEPSIFTGTLKEAVVGTFKTIAERFTYGGVVNKEQRVYYINVKEINDRKFGTAQPIPFRVVDHRINLDIDVTVRCNGSYSCHITDPVAFFTNVTGNFNGAYTFDNLEAQMKAELLSALQPAFGKISKLEVRPSELPLHVEELCTYLNEVLTTKWKENRGIEMLSIAINSITLPAEDEQLIKDAQKTGMLKDKDMIAATIASATAEALKEAAKNPNGAMNGIVGVNMVNNASGINVNELFTKEEKGPTWTCSCGTVNTGNFCSNCGKAKPTPGAWTCSCGTVNTGNFCSNCGKGKPE